MRASGCSRRMRNCWFPKDKNANIEPLGLYGGPGQYEFIYSIEWGERYKQAPMEARTRTICMYCARIVQDYSISVAKESRAIDDYYERRNSERCTRKRSA